MIKDFIYVYKNSIIETFDVIKKRPWIIFVPVLGGVVINLFFNFALTFGILNNRFSYLITNLVYAIVLSGIFYLYNQSIDRKGISPLNLSDGAVMFVFDIYLVRFAMYLLTVLFAMLDPTGRISNIVIIGVYVLFSPISELIYLRGIRNFQDLSIAPKYVLENWYLWLPHGLIFSLFADPVTLYIYPIMAVDLWWILAGIIFSTYLVFRGVMFKNTFRSTRRKREFMGEFK